jgi:methyl-accepting chemotaxis protein
LIEQGAAHPEDILAAQRALESRNRESAVGDEMSRNVQEAAQGSAEIFRNLQAVAQRAGNTRLGTQEAVKAAQKLTEIAAQFRSMVEQFKLRDAREDGQSSTPHFQARAAQSAVRSGGQEQIRE